MKAMSRSGFLLLVVVIAAMAFGATPASATPTCNGAASCVVNLTGTGTFSVAGVSVSCTWNVTGTIRTGTDAVSSSRLTFTSCTSNNSNCARPVVTTASQIWTITLSSSRPIAGTTDSYPLTITTGGLTTIDCGAAGNVRVAARTSCVHGVNGTTALLTTRPPFTITVSCRISYTATGLITLIIGASGTATLTVSLSDATRPASVLTVSP